MKYIRPKNKQNFVSYGWVTEYCFDDQKFHCNNYNSRSVQANANISGPIILLYRFFDGKKIICERVQCAHNNWFNVEQNVNNAECRWYACSNITDKCWNMSKSDAAICSSWHFCRTRYIHRIYDEEFLPNVIDVHVNNEMRCLLKLSRCNYVSLYRAAGILLLYKLSILWFLLPFNQLHVILCRNMRLLSPF